MSQGPCSSNTIVGAVSAALENCTKTERILTNFEAIGINKREKCRRLRAHLKLLLHALGCSTMPCDQTPFCSETKQLLIHIKDCKDTKMEEYCMWPHCTVSQLLLKHCETCSYELCLICRDQQNTGAKQIQTGVPYHIEWSSDGTPRIEYIEEETGEKELSSPKKTVDLCLYPTKEGKIHPTAFLNIIADYAGLLDQSNQFLEQNAVYKVESWYQLISQDIHEESSIENEMNAEAKKLFQEKRQEIIDMVYSMEEDIHRKSAQMGNDTKENKINFMYMMAARLHHLQVELEIRKAIQASRPKPVDVVPELLSTDIGVAGNEQNTQEANEE